VRALIGFTRRWCAVLLLPPLMAVACTTVAPTKATNPEPFYGTWVGSWRSQVNPASHGDLEVEIAPDVENRPQGIRFTAKLTNAVVPWFAATGVFLDGALAFTTGGGSTLQFMLHGQDRIEATYYNPNNRDSGTWTLKRRPR
jgi:hypothetical protein